MTLTKQEMRECTRDAYDSYPLPLIHFLCSLHGLSIRDFAEIFHISKNHAEAVMKHKIFPSLELGIRIARYFEVTTDDLFAWRIPDTEERRPLVVWIPEYGGWVRLRNDDIVKPALKLAEFVANGGNGEPGKVRGVRKAGTAGVSEGVHCQGEMGSSGQSNRDELECEAEAVPPGVDADGNG